VESKTSIVPRNFSKFNVKKATKTKRYRIIKILNFGRWTCWSHRIVIIEEQYLKTQMIKEKPWLHAMLM